MNTEFDLDVDFDSAILITFTLMKSVDLLVFSAMFEAFYIGV